MCIRDRRSTPGSPTTSASSTPPVIISVMRSGLSPAVSYTHLASIGINVQITGLTGVMLAFSLLLLLISIISKLLGCGLGAKACHFSTRESIQVGAGIDVYKRQGRHSAA